MQVRGRWVPPWHILAGAVLLAVSLLHFLATPAGASGLDYLEYVSLGAVALCLPRIALRAALALRRGVSVCVRGSCRASRQGRQGQAAWRSGRPPLLWQARSQGTHRLRQEAPWVLFSCPSLAAVSSFSALPCPPPNNHPDDTC